MNRPARRETPPLCRDFLPSLSVVQFHHCNCDVVPVVGCPPNRLPLSIHAQQGYDRVVSSGWTTVSSQKLGTRSSARASLLDLLDGEEDRHLNHSDDGVHEDGPASRKRHLSEEGTVCNGPLHRRVSVEVDAGDKTRRRTSAATKDIFPDSPPLFTFSSRNRPQDMERTGTSPRSSGRRRIRDRSRSRSPSASAR